jgi:PEP-CTERM motif
MNKAIRIARCRSTFCFLGLWLSASAPELASGQGLISFSNIPAKAAVYDVDGMTPLGFGFLAQLYATPAGKTSLTPVGSPVEFVGLGYFYDNTPAEVPGAFPGQQALVQVRVWRASDGASFEAADHPGAHVGVSEPLAVTLGSALGDPPPAPLFGLKGFSLYAVVPEPSAFALALLGAGALAAFGRRRKER